MLGLKAIIVSVIIGAVSGWLAGSIMETNGGLVKNIILGIVGGAVANFLFGLIGISFHGLIGSIIASVIGACLLIWIGRKLFK